MSKSIRDLLINQLEELMYLVEQQEFDCPQIDSSMVESKRIITQIKKGDKEIAGLEDSI